MKSIAILSLSKSFVESLRILTVGKILPALNLVQLPFYLLVSVGIGSGGCWFIFSTTTIILLQDMYLPL